MLSLLLTHLVPTSDSRRQPRREDLAYGKTDYDDDATTTTTGTTTNATGTSWPRRVTRGVNTYYSRNAATKSAYRLMSP